MIKGSIFQEDIAVLSGLHLTTELQNILKEKVKEKNLQMYS